MKYIEFVGQHTAGKTSTIKRVVDGGKLEPLRAMYPQQVRRSKLHFVCMLPLLALQNVHHLFFVTFFFVRYAKWNWINYHAAGRHLIKMVVLHPYFERYNYDVWMKDDMLHLLPRIEFRSGVDVGAVLKNYFDHFAYRYDGIVYIDLPYDVMHERFAKRFDDRPVARRKSREPVYERSFKQTLLLREIIRTQTTIPVLELNGTDTIEANADRVTSFVRDEIMTTRV